MSNYAFAFLTFVLSCIPIYSGNGTDSLGLQFIHTLIALICSVALFSQKNRPFSLYKMVHLFFLFFLCVAPIIQFRESVYFFGTRFSEYDYVFTSFIVLLILIFLDIIYLIKSKKASNIILASNACHKSLTIKKELCFVIISWLIVFIFLYINKFNIVSIFVRGGESATRLDVSKTYSLLLENFCRPIPMIFFLVAYIYKTPHKFVLYLLFIAVLISNPLTGLSRFAAAAIYIPICLTILPMLKKRNVFVLSMVVGLLLIFPFLNNFRYFSSNTDIELGFNFDQFKELHFDSYSMFMRVLKFDIVTYGYQLLGVFLFWVPRSFWPSKPIGSGAFMADETNLSFSNISMPYFGEGYINFGYIGIVLFTFVLACIMAKYDNQYWKAIYKQDKNIESIKYFILIGFFMMIMRGDLLSSFAFLCGYLSSFYVIKHLMKI